MKQVTIYSAVEFKALNDKRQAYEQWNNLTVSELMNVYSAVIRQLNFKFNSPFNLSRAKRNEMFSEKLRPIVENIDTLTQYNDELRSNISGFYDYIKAANANNSSENGRSLDQHSGVPQTDRDAQTTIDSTVNSLTNRVEFLMKKLEAMGIDATADENTPEAIAQIQEQIDNAQLNVANG